MAVEPHYEMDDEELADRPKGEVSTREEFAATELVPAHEMAATAVAAQARAAIEARYVVALKRPRDLDDVRQRLLKECRRSGFAEVARYRKPVGDGHVEGLSIRFAEAAIRSLWNVLVETDVLYDDEQHRLVRVSVTDLEANISYPTTVSVEKTVERRKLGQGQQPVSMRYNSRGNKVYLVRATDDELLNKQNALVSKALRNAALRILPGDLADECEKTIAETLRSETEKDPDAARKKLADSFAALNIMPSALKEYLGHDLGESSPAELEELRLVYRAIRDSETTWQAALASKLGTDDEEPAATRKDAAAEKLREKLDKAKGAKVPAAPPPAGKWDAKGNCTGCGRAQALVEGEGGVGHAPGCPHATKEN